MTVAGIDGRFGDLVKGDGGEVVVVVYLRGRVLVG